jgi:hypothetical protein
MECSDPGLIRAEELLAYLAGERVRPVVEQHLAQCPYCSARLADFRHLELSFLSKLYRWDCPPAQVLGEYQLGLLDPATAQAIRFHLHTCVSCVAELSGLGGFLAGDPFLVEQVLPEWQVVPQTVRNNHHAPPQTISSSLKEVLARARADARRVVATLLPPAPRLVYQRNTAPSDLWPRQYAAEDFRISLQIERETGRADSFQLIGFVTRKDTTLEALQGTPVLLSSQTAMTVTQHIDDLGNFVFSSLVQDLYTLELQTSDDIVVIEQIAVEAPEQ